MKKTIDDFIKEDLYGAVDAWMRDNKRFVIEGEEDVMRSALISLIEEGVILYQEFEK